MLQSTVLPGQQTKHQLPSEKASKQGKKATVCCALSPYNAIKQNGIFTKESRGRSARAGRFSSQQCHNQESNFFFISNLHGDGIGYWQQPALSLNDYKEERTSLFDIHIHKTKRENHEGKTQYVLLNTQKQARQDEKALKLYLMLQQLCSCIITPLNSTTERIQRSLVSLFSVEIQTFTPSRAVLRQQCVDLPAEEAAPSAALLCLKTQEETTKWMNIIFLPSTCSS